MDVDKYRLNPRMTFNVFVDKNYKNVNKIHPIMQKDVGIILNELQKYSEVKRIIVFGSAITDRCTYESDIDIYVELSENKNVKTYDVLTPVDYWNNFTVDKNMLEEILDKGVVIYDCK